jgi:hypothetical protein
MVPVEAYFKMYSTAYDNHFPAMCLVNEGHVLMSYSIRAKLHAFLTTTQASHLRPLLTYYLGGESAGWTEAWISQHLSIMNQKLYNFLSKLNE